MNSTTNESKVVFIVPKMSAEVCDVVVVPASPLPEAEEENGFKIKTPEIIDVKPGSDSVGKSISILGNYFGSGKGGKVYLGYTNVKNGKYTKKSCSIVSWDGDEVVFTVPALSLGPYDVIVTNSVGSTKLSGGFVIE